MKIIVKGNSKEIADLMLQIQNWQVIFETSKLKKLNDITLDNLKKSFDNAFTESFQHRDSEKGETCNL